MSYWIMLVSEPCGHFWWICICFPFPPCSNRPRRRSFALRPCLWNVWDMHWASSWRPCKIIFLVQKSRVLFRFVLSVASSMIQNSVSDPRFMTQVYVPLDPPSWTLNEDNFLKSFTSRTKAVVLNRSLFDSSCYLHVDMFAHNSFFDLWNHQILHLQPTQSNREGLQQRGVAYYLPGLSENGLLCDNWWGTSVMSNRDCSYPHT